MEADGQCRMIVSFGKERIEAAYTKRDAFILMDCDEEHIFMTPQADASVILLVNNKSNQEFIDDYLEFAKDKRVLTKNDNEMGSKLLRVYHASYLLQVKIK